MSKFRLFAVLVSFCVLPAGQIWASPVSDLSPPSLLQEAVCVPPSLPPFSQWKGGPAEHEVFEDEFLRPVPGLRRLYFHGSLKILTFWVNGILISLDAAPADPSQPIWQERGALTPNGRLRANARQACDWFQPPVLLPPKEPTT